MKPRFLGIDDDIPEQRRWHSWLVARGGCTVLTRRTAARAHGRIISPGSSGASPSSGLPCSSGSSSRRKVVAAVAAADDLFAIAGAAVAQQPGGSVHARARLIGNRPLHDTARSDPGKSQRYLDTVAHLVRNGRRTRPSSCARNSCAVRRSGQYRAGDDVGIPRCETRTVAGFQTADTSRAITVAGKIRRGGTTAQKYAEANRGEASWTSVTTLLMRLYAENLRQPNWAREVLHLLSSNRTFPGSHREFCAPIHR